MLAECGQDIDAAIRRLTELKLTSQEQAQTGAHDTSRAADDRQQQQQSAAADGVSAPTAPGLQTADQWVDALVQEMAAAKDFADARGRAGKMLQAFEQFVSTRSKEQVWPAAQFLLQCPLITARECYPAVLIASSCYADVLHHQVQADVCCVESAVIHDMR